jgi:hypothetical protein
LIAALYVETGGVYFGLPGVDPWDKTRDARTCRLRIPAVAHPSCERWGRFWHGSTRKPHQFQLGDDEGKFAAALTYVRNNGGVLEHPAGSGAWRWFGLSTPSQGSGWIKADNFGGWTCQIDQKHYGHIAPKPSWLYAVDVDLVNLIWDKSDRTPPQYMIDKYGEKKARKVGQVAMIGGKDKKAKRERTPEPFRDLLLDMARSVYVRRELAL